MTCQGTRKNTTHRHAVLQVGSQTYGYDANGNMTTRGAQSLQYDAENRLTQVISGTTTTQYVYNGDGQRVKQTVNGVTTYYIGNYYEVTNGVATKYYYFGTQRVAMRNANGVTYLHGDHLGSTSATSGAQNSKQWYYAFGAVRATEGTLPTDYTYTGQKQDSDGLSFYNARYYDSAIGRFIQPDTITPNIYNPQDLNRYAYTRNNPVCYTDPSGHCDPDDCRWKPKENEDDDWEMHNRHRYNSSESTSQAIQLVIDWVTNNDQTSEVTFDTDSSLTLDVIRDPGMDEFRQVWGDNGYSLPFSWNHHRDPRDGSLGSTLKGIGSYEYQNGNLLLAVLGQGSQTAEGPIDPVGGILGSLDTISVSDAGNGLVRFQVDNVMNVGSGFRKPGSNDSLLEPLNSLPFIPSQRTGWPGSQSHIQHFVWYEGNFHR